MRGAAEMWRLRVDDGESQADSQGHVRRARLKPRAQFVLVIMWRISCIVELRLVHSAYYCWEE